MSHVEQIRRAAGLLHAAAEAGTSPLPIQPGLAVAMADIAQHCADQLRAQPDRYRMHPAVAAAIAGWLTDAAGRETAYLAGRDADPEPRPGDEAYAALLIARALLGEDGAGC